MYPYLNRFKIFKTIPVPLFIVTAAILTSLGLGFHSGFEYQIFGAAYEVSSKALIELPKSLLNSIQFPDWSVILSFTSIKYIIMFTLVGSIESLLTVSAVDEISEGRQKSKQDRDLLGVGIANICVGFIGGLPMISEVARSKANVDAGAQSQYSNFFHGLFLLAYVILLPDALSLLPLSCLAAMLIYVGCRLASPSEFKLMWKIGPEQFAFFAITCIVTVTTDLLLGVSAGILTAYIFAAAHARSFTKVFQLRARVEENEELMTVRIAGSATFLNSSNLHPHIERAQSANKPITWDFTHASVVEHTFLAKLNKTCHGTNKKPQVKGLKALSRLSKHQECSRVKVRSPR